MASKEEARRETIDFLVKLVRATDKETLAWTITGNDAGKQPIKLKTVLGHRYVAKLKKVAAFEGGGLPDRGPEFILNLSHRGTKVLSLDRRNVNGQQLAQQWKPKQPWPVEDTLAAPLFQELWLGAKSNAEEATAHLRAVNSLLEDSLTED